MGGLAAVEFSAEAAQGRLYAYSGHRYEIIVHNLHQTRADGMSRPVATGFFVEIPVEGPNGKKRYAMYLVTARHNVLELGSSEWCVRANLKGGGMALVSDTEYPSKWFYHPDEKKFTDIAVIPFRPPENFDISAMVHTYFWMIALPENGQLALATKCFLQAYSQKCQAIDTT